MATNPLSFSPVGGILGQALTPEQEEELYRQWAEQQLLAQQQAQQQAAAAQPQPVPKEPVPGRQYNVEDAIQELGMSPEQAQAFVASLGEQAPSAPTDDQDIDKPLVKLQPQDEDKPLVRDTPLVKDPPLVKQDDEKITAVDNPLSDAPPEMRQFDAAVAGFIRGNPKASGPQVWDFANKLSKDDYGGQFGYTKESILGVMNAVHKNPQASDEIWIAKSKTAPPKPPEVPEVPISQQVREAGQTFVANIVRLPGSALSGLAEGSEAATRRIRDLASRVGAEKVVDVLMAPAEYAGITSGARTAGEKVKGWAEALDIPEDRRGTITNIVASSLGQVSGQIVMALAGGEVPAATAYLGQSFDQLHDAIKQAGKQGTAGADYATLIAGPIMGLTEKTGIDAILERVPPAIRNRVLRGLADVTMAGGIEAAQEVAEQLVQNVALKLGVNEDQRLTEGMRASAVGGGGAGLIIRSLLGARGPITARAQQNAAINEIDQAQFAVSPEAIAAGRTLPSRGAVAGVANDIDALPEARPLVAPVAGETRIVKPSTVPVNSEGEAENLLIPSGQITSRFGPRHTFRTANGQMASSNHAGIDIALPSGTPVPAGGSGVVAFAGKRGGYGNQVVIKFSDGTSVSYSHLSRIDASVGDSVTQGEVVGRVGATGNATGPHLHLERRDAQGRPVNPLTARVVGTGQNEDGTVEDDTPWNTSDTPYNNEEDAPFPLATIDDQWEKTTGQRLARQDPEAEAPEPVPPSTAEVVASSPVATAVAEVLQHSPVPQPEEVVADVSGSLDTAKSNNQAAQALAQIQSQPEPLPEAGPQQEGVHDFSQPLPGEQPLFAEDQQTVVGFVNEAGDTRALREEPTQSGTEDFVAAGLSRPSATTPQPQEGSLAPVETQPPPNPAQEVFDRMAPLAADMDEARATARLAGRAAALGLQEEPADLASQPVSFRTAYNVGFREGTNAGQEAGLEAAQAPAESQAQPEAVAQPEPTVAAPVAPVAASKADKTIDARMDKIYDKLFDLENEGTKGKAKLYAQQLVKQGVLEQGEVDALAHIMRDRDMSVEDITSEIKASAEMWADNQRKRVKAQVVQTKYGQIEEPAADDFSFEARIKRNRIEESRNAPEQGRPTATEPRGEEGARLERPPVEKGHIILDHFSVEEELSSTDPAFFGRHTQVFSRQELAYLKEAPPRTYFGIAAGQNGGYKNEFTGRAHFQARIPEERLYDVAKDPDKLWVRGQPAASEWNIKNAGYAGYWHNNPQLGLVAIVFEPVQVSKVAGKPKPQVKPQPKPAPKPEAKPKPQTSREIGQQREEARKEARATKATILKNVLKIYAEMGAGGMIPVHIADVLGTEQQRHAGEYDPQSRAIYIAAFSNPYGYRHTARHEVVHWAVDNDVWNADEWRLLKKWAQAQPGLMAWVRENYPPSQWTEEEILEEAVAEGFARWDNGRLHLAKPDTALDKIFQKLKDIIDAMRLAFAQAGVSRGELREATRLLAEFENGKRLAKLRRAERPTFGRREWNDDLSREMLSGNISPEQHWFLSQQKGQRFQSGWHGSPKEDIDKFNLDFIGTGEGAQAFGWGLYFAEKKAVAEWYQRKLTMNTKDPVDVIIEVNGHPIRDWAKEYLSVAGVSQANSHAIAIYEVADRVFSFLTTNKPYNGWLDAIHARIDNDIDGWIAAATKEGNSEEVQDLQREQQRIADVMTSLSGQKVEQKTYPTGGKLYKVEVPENEDLLDLDKPIRKQSDKIKAAARQAKIDLAKWGIDLEELQRQRGGSSEDMTGLQLQSALKDAAALGWMIGSEKVNNAVDMSHAGMAASIYLREQGVAGSRYLDRDSRSLLGPGEKPTHNFVIFDDNAIELKAKYQVIKSNISNSPLSDPTIPDPGMFRRLHDQTMGLLTAIGSIGKGTTQDWDAADNAIDAFRRKVTQRYQQIIKTQRRAEAMLGVDRMTPESNVMDTITADERGYKLQFVTDNMTRPMFREMSNRGVSTEDLGLYLYARHAPARNARIAKINKEFRDPNNPGSGMKDTEAQQIMADFAAAGRLDDLQAVATYIDAMINYAQQQRLASGLLSQEDADAGFQPGDFYVPLRGNENLEPELEMDFGTKGSKGGGFSVAGKESHRMFGRASMADLAEIVGYSITQTHDAIDRSYRNQIGQTALNLFRQVPDPQFVQIDRVKRVPVWNRKTGKVEYQMQTRLNDEEQQRTIFVKVDGDVVKMTFNNQNPSAMRFVKAAKNLGHQEVGQLLRAMSIYTRIFTKANTQWNIDFILANAAKDIQTGVINASTLNQKGLRRAMIRNLLSMRPLMGAWWGTHHPAGAGLGSAVKHREAFAEFEANGGKLNYGQTGPVEDAIRQAKADIKNFGRSPFNPIKAVRAVGEWLDRAGSAFENMTRLSLFMSLRDMGIPAKQAAVAARELTTNFQQHGEWGPKFNAAYGFANASVIGGARFTYTLAKKPALIAGLLGIGMLEDWLNHLLSDDWDKYEEDEKDHEFKLLLPEAFGFDLKFPIGYGINSFVTAGRKMSELWRGKKKADGTSMSVLDAASDVGWSMFNAFSPVAGHTFFNVVTPSIGDPIVDIYQNQDNWGRPIMPKKGEWDRTKPDSQLANKNTEQFWRVLAEGMNQIGGGNKVVAGASPLDLSPETYKYVSQQLTGGAGRSLMRALELPFKAESGDVGLNDVPVVRRFAGNPYAASNDKQAGVSAFYDRLRTAQDVIKEAKDTIKVYGKDSEEYRDFKKDHAGIIAFDKTMEKANRINARLSAASKAAANGAAFAKGLDHAKRHAIFKATGILLPTGRPLTPEEVAKVEAKLKEKRETLAERFNQRWLTDVMGETE